MEAEGGQGDAGIHRSRRRTAAVSARLRDGLRAAWWLSFCKVWGEIEEREWGLSRKKRCINWWIKSLAIDLELNVQKVKLRASIDSSAGTWWRRDPRARKKIKEWNGSAAAVSLDFIDLGARVFGLAGLARLCSLAPLLFFFGFFLLFYLAFWNRIWK